MKLTRRQGLFHSVGTVLSACSATRGAAENGVGPNRGMLQKTLRGKQTYSNVTAPVSNATTLLAVPEDFSGGKPCQLVEDNFEGPYFTCTPTAGRSIAVEQPGQPLTVALRLVDSPTSYVIWEISATQSTFRHGFALLPVDLRRLNKVCQAFYHF